jgi:transcription elongation factor GreA
MIKVTKKGIEILNQKINTVKERLKEIRCEKAVAYESTGDTWHDNPYFNKLEQEEKAENNNLLRLGNILTTAEVVEWDERNTEVIEIGSIALCYCKYPDFDDEVVYEIVGYGESDFENGRIAYDTPVGSQLLGVVLGEEKIVKTPGGEVVYNIKRLYKNWDEVDV